MLHGMAETLKACTAQDPLLQQQAIALGEWVEREGLPEETLESQVAWQVMEHCSGTPGALRLADTGRLPPHCGRNVSARPPHPFASDRCQCH